MSEVVDLPGDVRCDYSSLHRGSHSRSIGYCDETQHIFYSQRSRMTHSAAGAPYFPGQSLDLYVLTKSGGVRTSSTLRIRVDITSLCVPFTKSQVMRIAIPPETGSGLPLKAILKLYDRQYIDDRDKDLWSLTSEAAVRSARREKRWGEFPLDPLDEPEEEEEELPGYTDEDGIFHFTGPTVDNRDEAEKEEEYLKYCMISSTGSRVPYTSHYKSADDVERENNFCNLRFRHLVCHFNPL